MSNIVKHHLDESIPEEYHTLADRTAQDMAMDHIYSAYELIVHLHPEIKGMQATIIQKDDGTDYFAIDLMRERDDVK